MVNGAMRLPSHNEYLLPLTDGFDSAIIAAGASIDLVLDHKDGFSLTVVHFRTTENVFLADESTPPKDSLILKANS